MKPAIPKGTRDFLPYEVRQRQYIFNVLREVFELFDFAPIETPAIEKLETLTGKYGEEGDRLLFKLLNNGEFYEKVDESIRKTGSSTDILPHLSKRGLRYDLTVPLARFVVMHQNDLSFPFKRYQIQPVWRADRPQKGRYWEFYQCDVDVLGSDSLIYEAELVQIYDLAFTRLNIPVDIKINNRKILQGIADVVGCSDQFMQFTVILDKLDKIGKSGVSKQYSEMGLHQDKIDLLFEIIETKELSEIEEKLNESEIGRLGISEIKQLQEYLSEIKLNQKITFDWSLARGLNYYTGCIFEVICPDVKIGSIGGGGRYDDLTGIFGMNDVSGVGVSFGAARIYDVMTTLDLFPETLSVKTKILLIAFDEASHTQAFRYLNQLRAAGIPSAIYPEPVKLKKQMKYANDRNVPFVGLIGDSELESNQLTIKDMATGDQKMYSIEEGIVFLK